MVQQIVQVIYDRKGSNVIAIDVRGISSATDYIVIAEGNVDRHVTALANEVQELMREAGEKPVYVEGMQNGDWVVLDYFHIVVHILLPDMREKYQLERLWPDGKTLELNNIEVGNE